MRVDVRGKGSISRERSKFKGKMGAGGNKGRGKDMLSEKGEKEE
jgi:hypothetical protein